jgi:hypothetical protein
MHRMLLSSSRLDKIEVLGLIVVDILIVVEVLIVVDILVVDYDASCSWYLEGLSWAVV